MDRINNICFLLLGAFLTVVTADAPLGLHLSAIPAAEYGVPKVVPLGPYVPAIPAPVYGVPEVLLPRPVPVIKTSYKYELINPPKPIEILAPYPAPVPVVRLQPHPVPVVPAPVYGPPKVAIIKPAVVKSSYSYSIPHQPIVKVYPVPAPVYGPPKLRLPVVPAPVYGLPKIELPVVKPIEVVAKLAPYPAPLPAVIPPLPIVPHSEYGVPLF